MPDGARRPSLRPPPFTGSAASGRRACSRVRHLLAEWALLEAHGQPVHAARAWTRVQADGASLFARELPGPQGEQSGAKDDVGGTADSGVREATPGEDLAAATHFQARLEDGAVVLDVTMPEPLYYQTCTFELPREKLLDGSWVPLIDDRPPYWNSPGYFLDDEFVPPTSNEGCDVFSCEQVPELWHAGPAMEWVKLGEQPPPQDAVYEDGARPALVPVIESRPYHGKLRVHVAVGGAAETACMDEERRFETTVELTVP